MNQLLTLGELLGNPQSCPENHCVFLPMDQEWSEATPCAVIEHEDLDARDEHPLPTSKGLKYALGTNQILEIIDNATQQIPGITVSQLIQAFVFYFDNDAFIEFP